MSSSTGDLLAGAAAGGIARMVVAPLDLIKIRVQLGSVGLISTARRVWRVEGWRAFWKGNLAAEAMVVPYCALQFAVYHRLRTREFDNVTAGAMAGACSTLLTYPMDLARTRLAAQHESHETLRNLCRELIRHGWTGMFQGLWPTLVGIVPYTGLQFAFYEGLSAFAANRVLPSVGGSFVADSSISFGCGFISGILAKIATMPLDVVKKFYQVNNYTWAAAGTKQARHVNCQGIYHCAQHIVRRYGYRGLYRGSAASLLKAGPNSAVSFFVFDLCQKPFRLAMGEEQQ